MKTKKALLIRMTAIIALIVMLLAMPGVSPTNAANPSPVLVFYVTLPESEALTALSAINAAAVQPMTTYNTIAINEKDTLVYYDQWENGYDADIANPTNLYSVQQPGRHAGVGQRSWQRTAVRRTFEVIAVTCTNANDVLHAGDVVLMNNTVALPRAARRTNNVLDNFNTVSLQQQQWEHQLVGSWVETGDGPGVPRIIATNSPARHTTYRLDRSPGIHPWTEVGDDGSATTGYIRVDTTNGLRFGRRYVDTPLALRSPARPIYPAIPLRHCSYSFTRRLRMQLTMTVQVQVSESTRRLGDTGDDHGT